ncbi:hypothetical protein [Nocardia tengchongensis]|uniref:hypothetical protein n=1 Tax=Nocardia tengchongensis TaxID=2055889 RepID=UPI0036B901D3
MAVHSIVVSRICCSREHSEYSGGCRNRLAHIAVAISAKTLLRVVGSSAALTINRDVLVPEAQYLLAISLAWLGGIDHGWCR